MAPEDTPGCRELLVANMIAQESAGCIPFGISDCLRIRPLRSYAVYRKQTSYAEEHHLERGRHAVCYLSRHCQGVPLCAQRSGLCDHACRIGGKNVIVTHRSRRGTERLLAGSNMQRYFAGWLTANDGFPRKPDPAAFNAVQQLRQLKREETLAVGDRDLDIQAKRAAGLFTVRFDTAAADGTADLTIQSYSALQAALAPNLA